MNDEQIARRLRRLEQQIRAFRDLHVSEVSELARKLTAISQLQSEELQLILGELESLTRDVEAARSDGAAANATVAADTVVAASPGDPGAVSPKRAQWLAEQERRSHVSRRELLLGRDEKRPEDPSG